MDLNGYSAVDIKPWEAASGGRAVEVSTPDGQGSLSFHYSGKPGRYDLSVQYFDENDGTSAFTLLVAGRPVEHWLADDSLSSSRPDGHTSTRRTIGGLSLKPGNEIRIEAIAEGAERACIDYVEIVPSAH